MMSYWDLFLINLEDHLDRILKKNFFSVINDNLERDLMVIGGIKIMISCNGDCPSASSSGSLAFSLSSSRCPYVHVNFTTASSNHPLVLGDHTRAEDSWSSLILLTVSLNVSSLLSLLPPVRVSLFVSDPPLPVVCPHPSSCCPRCARNPLRCAARSLSSPP